mmetsp:Transcript_8557/g.20030  ORF Transcript_8557/g.20030 Transcript_8557/m.20030 type:complete len:153 (+) Transcript_8557:54-512(+)
MSGGDEYVRPVHRSPTGAPDDASRAMTRRPSDAIPEAASSGGGAPGAAADAARESHRRPGSASALLTSTTSPALSAGSIESSSTKWREASSSVMYTPKGKNGRRARQDRPRSEDAAAARPVIESSDCYASGSTGSRSLGLWDCWAVVGAGWG